MKKAVQLSQLKVASPYNPELFRAENWLPKGLGDIRNHQTALPRIAKDKALIRQIEELLPQIPTQHDLVNADARNLELLAPSSVHLVLTSPPYWKLKEYRKHPDQLGAISDYESFIEELSKVWRGCYRAFGV